jgi:predicted MPP superfamily phosphohydrolase
MRSRKVLAIVLGVILLAEYYSFTVVRSAVRSLPPVWRISLFSIYLFFTAGTWLSFIFFRRIDWAHLPHLLRNVFVAFTIGFFVGKVFVLLIMMLDDVRRVIMWIIHFFMPASSANAVDFVQKGMSRSTFFRQVALLVGGTWLAAFIYGISNRYKYRIRRVKLSFNELPAAFKGLKIVQVSDIHTGSFDNHAAVELGIQSALNEKPDIIFFTGDLVNNHTEEVDKKYQEIYARLKAPLGVYSILGNHDYGDYVEWPSFEAKKKNLQDLKDMQAAMGWRMLNNDHTVLEKGDDKIAIIGVENWSAKANFPKYGDLAKAYYGLDEKIPFKILLSHDPSHWDAKVRPDYPDIQLTLSGHTHGMQFGVEIPGFKWSPVKYIYSKWAGLYNEGRQYLYVNRGFGFLGYPGRLGIMPEITVIELV